MFCLYCDRSLVYNVLDVLSIMGPMSCLYVSDFLSICVRSLVYIVSDVLSIMCLISGLYVSDVVSVVCYLIDVF